MRSTRLFFHGNLECGSSIFLDTAASSHLIRVLRTKPDSEITLFNGDGFNYHCKTLDDNPRKTRLNVIEKHHQANESPLKITLFQGLSRQDRMDTCIQKSVELGVTKIVPVICQRSNIKLSHDKLNKKREHWKKIIISACEQSGRCILPDISSVIYTADIKSSSQASAHRIVLDPQSTTSPKILFGLEQPENNTIEIAVGPEGGFTDEEVTLLEETKFQRYSFGPRILRTETAGPALISVLQTVWGDF